MVSRLAGNASSGFQTNPEEKESRPAFESPRVASILNRSRCEQTVQDLFWKPEENGSGSAVPCSESRKYLLRILKGLILETIEIAKRIVQGIPYPWQRSALEKRRNNREKEMFVWF